MSRAEAELVAALNAIPAGDAEAAHGDADALVEKFLAKRHPAVAEALRAVKARAGAWWYA